MLQTKKTGKGGKANAKKGKKPAAGGSKGKGKKNPKKRPKKGAKKDSADSKESSKEDKEKKSTDECKWFSDSISFTLSSSVVSSYESCGCGASIDHTVSQIPRSTDWPVSFLLLSAVDFVSYSGLDPETIVSQLSLKLGGRIAHCLDSYRTIGAKDVHLNILVRISSSLVKGGSSAWGCSQPQGLR